MVVSVGIVNPGRHPDIHSEEGVRGERWPKQRQSASKNVTGCELALKWLCLMRMEEGSELGQNYNLPEVKGMLGWQVIILSRRPCVAAAAGSLSSHVNTACMLMLQFYLLGGEHILTEFSTNELYHKLLMNDQGMCRGGRRSAGETLTAGVLRGRAPWEICVS